MDRQKALAKIDQVIANGKYQDNWDSLSQYRVPDWYADLKFGIFIHWGVYSVPAFANEWYPRNMYIQGTDEFAHHVKTYGPHKDFGYKDFIPMFKAEKFDPEKWAALFEQAGAQYVLPVAEHHDGFQMYHSELSHWNATEMGPKRDVLGELYQAFGRHGLMQCCSNHRIEHWFFMGHGREFDSDIKEPLQLGDLYWPAQPELSGQHDLFSKPTPTKEFLEDWLLRCCELIDQYRPRILYFDWWIQHSAVKPYLQKFAAYYYNRGEEWGTGVVINYKHDAFAFGTAVPDIERGQFAQPKPFLWQSDTAIAKNSWCYTENNQFKKASDLICDMVDIVSKNGRFLLNVGPKADGTISDEDTKVLTDIGRWMKANGEAIYGTRTWRNCQEGPTAIEEGQFTDGKDKVFTPEDLRFTCKGSHIYVIALNHKQTGDLHVKSMADCDASHLPLFNGIIKDVDVLGFEEKPEWTRDGEALHIKTKTVQSDMPVVYRVTVC